MTAATCRVQFPLPLDDKLEAKRRLSGRETRLVMPDGKVVPGVRSITVHATTGGAVYAEVKLFVLVENIPR